MKLKASTKKWNDTANIVDFSEWKWSRLADIYICFPFLSFENRSRRITFEKKKLKK